MTDTPGHDDLMLMAYADGALPAAEARAVEARLATDPAARETLRRLRALDADLRAGLDPVLDEPVPAALVAAIERAAPPAPRPAANDNAWPRRLALAAAAAVLLMAGAGGGYLAADYRHAKAQVAVAEARRLAAERRADALQAALETRHSGQSAGWEAAAADEAGTVTPTRTFRNSQGRYCREYREEIRVGGRSETVMGIACRLPEGGWAPRYRVIPGADNI